MQPVLEVEDLCVDYEGRRCVSDVSFSVPRGSIVGLVGESGAGKSTALRAIVQLLPESASIARGSIVFSGKELVGLPEREWDGIRGKRIATIFQNPGSSLDPSARIGSQVVEVIRQHTGHSRPDATSEALELLERMRLQHPESLMRAYPFELSGGMQQRVAIALAMAFAPELLLADEPTSALDVTTQMAIVKEIIGLRREYGTSILLVTHNIGLAYHACDKIYVMQEGRIVEEGTADKVIGHPRAEHTRRLIAAVPKVERP